MPANTTVQVYYLAAFILVSEDVLKFGFTALQQRPILKSPHF
jgi:hypothetical protein